MKNYKYPFFVVTFLLVGLSVYTLSLVGIIKLPSDQETKTT